MVSDDELLARLRQLEDREAIRDLHNQYCFIQDRGHASHADRAGMEVPPAPRGVFLFRHPEGRLGGTEAADHGAVAWLESAGVIVDRNLDSRAAAVEVYPPKPVHLARDAGLVWHYEQGVI